MKLSGIHTTNPTKRLKIPSDKISITLHTDSDGNEAFELDLVLLSDVILGMNLQDVSAKVSLYAYSSNAEQEYELGTVSSFKKPSNLLLEELDFASLKGFRLIIFNDAQQIIASNETLKYRSNDEPEDENSLLNVELLDLGQRIWKVKLSDDTNPILVLNKSIPNIKNVVKDNSGILGCILPELTKECIVHLAFNKAADIYDKSCWQYNWGKFLESFGIQFENIPDLLEEPREYYSLLNTIDDLLESYCFQKKFASKFAKDIGVAIND
ncbi:hypothetical protein PTRA_b0098 [Pseudoalteromonas translucida KMM 520]|uniref:Uncharacterized protein n=1 Tax=Pseudoalteromonas translucida KMM 520 TaxID=1315283 RepID=A0A0U2WHW5_9GAMM|nr:hypothetical protein [Pseudoalteromonas translucida]ALS34631.1 hypothetical protein PTRA_b0098 [Pseudoalteromonas translucida KMM 520]